MTTRAIVPNGDGEGSLGTSTAKWGAIYSSDPASGENSGQVPTTAWVQAIVADAIKTAKDEIYKQAKLDAHPVGSYYWSNDSTSPATLFGGTWEALPPGYTLIAQGSGSDSFGSFTYESGKQYGERKHQLTTDELPKHSHEQPDWIWAVSKGFNTGTYNIPGGSSGNATTYADGKDTQRTWTQLSGNDAPHSNVQPVIASYGWKRTA
ncbi:MAG: hypothetical protein LKE88_00765 [Acidaminococcus provencensis]|jgi:hypothetical protein|uniref:phage baseplate protein n=1 Tax=Acidaminococcus provencensis TaxID=2058289 RepID=UPI0023F1EE83|nr:hypothetical protein [Acidaminococcus provencensis]MCH4095172.1 hypothetical protein [Acidaminococcus provencensis]